MKIDHNGVTLADCLAINADRLAHKLGRIMFEYETGIMGEKKKSKVAERLAEICDENELLFLATGGYLSMSEDVFRKPVSDEDVNHFNPN
jgi:hypothetical protein